MPTQYHISIPWRNFFTISNKLRKFLKGFQNSCKFQIAFKSQRKLSNAFLFKDRLPSIQCLEQYTNIRVVDAILPIMVRLIDTQNLVPENILGDHLCHLRKLNHQKRMQSVNVFYIAIISPLLRSLPSWKTEIINLEIKS